MKKIWYRISGILLSVLLLFLSGVSTVRVQATIIPGETWNYMKNLISYTASQIGVYWSGSAQQLVLNEAAWKEWMLDRYKNGFDGTAWNEEAYYTKECVRNDDGTVTLSDKFVDDTVAYIKELTDSGADYFLLKTVSLQNISPTWFPTKTLYDDFAALFNSHSLVYSGGIFSYSDAKYVSVSFPEDLDFAFYSSSMSSVFMYKNWVSQSVACYRLEDGKLTEQSFVNTTLQVADFVGQQPWFRGLVTKNGDYIKIYKDADAMKNSQTGYQPYYAGSNYINYDSSKDNSMTVGGDYLIGNDWSSINNNYYNSANNTIINNGGGDLSPNELVSLLDRLLEELKNSQDSGSSGGNGGTDKPDDSGGSGGGSGIGSLLEGIGKLFDFILELVGKLIGVLSDFLSKALGLLSGLSNLTGPFADLLAGLMPFIPSEVWDVIIAGLTLSVIIMVIKAFKG